MDQPAGEVVRALESFGLAMPGIESFLGGKAVVYQLPTWNGPGIALIQLVRSRLRSGIVEIDDPGGGVMDLLMFRNRSARLARALGATELEIFGGAVINRKLEALLIRRGFQRSEDAVPEELGGGMMEILSKVFAVAGAEG